jgi:hypothetical protein
MKTLFTQPDGTTVQQAKNGSLHATAYRPNEIAALRCAIDMELNGWPVSSIQTLGDGSCVIQATQQEGGAA